ncbi:MAG: PAS domain S-box protein [Rhodomicrobium sp.]
MQSITGLGGTLQRPLSWLSKFAKAFEPAHSIGRQLALGAAAAGLAEFAHLAFLGGVKHSDPVIFYPAATLAALAGRAPAGMLAVALSIAVIEYHSIIAPDSEGADSIISFDGLIFVFGSIFIIAVIEALHRARVGRERAAASLRAREARLKAVVDGAADGIIIADGRGVILSLNPAALNIFGYTAEETPGRKVHMLMPEWRRQAHDGYIAHYLKSGKPKIIEGRAVEGRRKDGSVFPMEVSLGEVSCDGECLFIATVRDITERKQAEEQIQLLMKEVNHRAKNLLMVALAVARQTAREECPEKFSERISERIRALAASHDLLMRSEWHGVDAGDLVRSQLAQFGQLMGTRIRLVGPAVRLSPAAAQAAGMALHELATNAGKYGALSNCEGRLLVAWEVSEKGRETCFQMRWIEEGGPPCAAPQRRGFGHTVMVEMVEQALDAEVRLAITAGGLAWELSAPAARAVEDGEGAADTYRHVAPATPA